MANDLPLRVQLRRTKGFNLQRESLALNSLPAVKVDRSTRWGNIYRVGMFKNFTAADAVEAFEARLKENMHDDARWIMEHIEELRNKNIACWCKLPKPGEPDLCHGTILLGIANPRALK